MVHICNSARRKSILRHTRPPVIWGVSDNFSSEISVEIKKKQRHFLINGGSHRQETLHGNLNGQVKGHI